MNKSELIAELDANRQNAVAGLACLALLPTPEVRPLLDRGYAQFGNFRVDFAEIGLLMRDDEKKTAFTAQFIRLLIHALVREPYDLIEQYCDSNSQAPQLKQQDWQKFARFIRDAAAKGYRFQFNTMDKALNLPVTWKNKTITGAHDGQPLDAAFFGMFEAWSLFMEMRAFAARLP